MNQTMTRTARIGSHLVAFAAAFGAASANATEGGGSTYPGGVENYLTGAAPPPGFYVVEYLQAYSANKLRDNRGESLPIDFKLRAFAAATRLVWSTPHEVMGGNLVLHSIVPVVDLKVSIGAIGASQHKTGLGDVTFGPAIAFHHSKSLHSVLAVDFVAPVGGYDKNDLVNIGRNYWSIQPLYTMSTIDPAGFNGDFKLTFNFNRKNSDTGYRSGNEVYLDYAAGWGLGNGWTVGVGGYAMQQLSDDELNGATVSNNKGRALAIGPSIKYDNGKGWFITAKLTPETSVRNRPEGTQFWIKTLIPF